MTPEDYLMRPYHYVLVSDDTSGTWTGVVQEFPGCIAQGEIAFQTFMLLEIAAKDWIAAALDLGQEIPEPKEKP